MKNQKSLPKENTDSTVNAMTEEIQKLQREVEKLRQEKRQQKNIDELKRLLHMTVEQDQKTLNELKKTHNDVLKSLESQKDQYEEYFGKYEGTLRFVFFIIVMNQT